MKKRMKAIIGIVFLLLFILAVPVTAYAEEEKEEQLREEYRLDEIYDSVPEETKDLLGVLGLDQVDYNNIINISFSQIFKTIEEVFLGVYKGPFSAALSVIAIILLSALIKGFSTSFNESTLMPVLSSSASVFVAVLLIVKISSCISNACSVIQLSAEFTVVFIPIFTFLVAASGHPLSAVGFNTFLFGLTQVLSGLAGTILMPVTNIFLGLGITAGIKPELHLSSITAFIKKNLVLILSFISTVFMTIVSIKSSVTANVDALGDKSLRFALSSFVPVIGSTISEGLASIKGYVSLMKSAAGIFSIIAIFLLFLPVLLELALWNVSLSVCGVCSDLFEEQSVGNIVKAVQDTLSLLIVILALCLVMTIISIGIMVSIKTGG